MKLHATSRCSSGCVRIAFAHHTHHLLAQVLGSGGIRNCPDGYGYVVCLSDLQSSFRTHK